MTMTIRPIENGEMSKAAHLTFPALAKAFSSPLSSDPSVQLLRNSAWLDDVPVGLALAKRQQQTGEAELMSLMVDKRFRRQGIGTALLRQTEMAVRSLQSSEILARFSDHLPGAHAFGQLLARENWSQPDPERIRILGQVGKTNEVFRDQAGLVVRAKRDGLQLIAWQDYPGDGKALVTQQIADGLAPEWTQMGLHGDNLDPEFSVILTTQQGAVVGWVICQFHAEIRRWSFPVGWITPEHQRRGWLLVAYADGARRLGERHGEASIAVFESTNAMPMMWRVLEGRFAPHAQLADYVLKSRKSF